MTDHASPAPTDPEPADPPPAETTPHPAAKLIRRLQHHNPELERLVAEIWSGHGGASVGAFDTLSRYLAQHDADKGDPAT